MSIDSVNREWISSTFRPLQNFLSLTDVHIFEGLVRHPSFHDQFLDSCVQFSHRGVQNLDLGGANAPPFAMPISLDLCGFSAHTRLTIGRGVQGGARGCIVKRV